jgi:hypothetical protein
MNGALKPERVAKRIAHIRSHLDVGFKLDQLVRNIENNLGNPRACVISLSGHAEASALYAWFEQRDLTSMRQWFHVAAKLDQKWYQMEEDRQGPGSKMLRLIKPLLSNDRSLIEWFSHYDQAFDMERVEKHSTHDFWAYQSVIALRGEWDRLAERCARVIRDPPGAAAEQKYLVDHQFYLALAERDIGMMAQALQKLVTPKMIQARDNDDSGYAADLISTAAVIYAKIAWFHGYEVRVDSPYIPAEWLPTEPLERYDDHYVFLK